MNIKKKKRTRSVPWQTQLLCETLLDSRLIQIRTEWWTYYWICNEGSSFSYPLTNAYKCFRSYLKHSLLQNTPLRVSVWFGYHCAYLHLVFIFKKCLNKQNLTHLTSSTSDPITKAWSWKPYINCQTLSSWMLEMPKWP